MAYNSTPAERRKRRERRTDAQKEANVKHRTFPISVRHKDGWCARTDQSSMAYADNIATKCGHIVVLPLGIERRQPTCAECCALANKNTA